MLDQFEQYKNVFRKITRETFMTMADIDEPGRLADMIASHLPLKITDKQDLLATENIVERMEKLVKLMTDEKKILDLERKIDQQVKASMEKTQKEYYLREQLKTIQKELGEQDGKMGEIAELQKRIETSDMPQRIV